MKSQRTTPNGYISTPIDEGTPQVCLVADGTIVDEFEKLPPHETNDPHRKCRCFVIPFDTPPADVI